MFLSLIQGPATSPSGTFLGAVVWQQDNATALDHPAGIGQVITDRCLDLTPGELAFVLSGDKMRGDGVLASHQLDGTVDSGPVLLRLDEVCFPVGAIAQRHTHSGPGIRHLIRGTLRIEGTGHTQRMRAGDSWFEPARTPVRAVAEHSDGVSSFVRCMILPIADLGRSTFRLEDQADADLPRLQLTHRHIDHILHVDAG